MKKAIIAATAGVALFGTGFLLGNVQNKKEILPTQENGVVFLNEKVAIKYFDASNGDYDILVETRNGTNIVSEWQMEETKNYSFAYLIGREENSAKEFHDMNLAKLGYEWNWEKNYDIEGVDVPYNLPK